MRRHGGVEQINEDMDILLQVLPHKEIYFLPLDTPDRQSYLDAINVALGTKLETDWPVIGHHDGKDVEHREEETSARAKVWDRYGDFFCRFYPDDR